MSLEVFLGVSVAVLGVLSIYLYGNFKESRASVEELTARRERELMYHQSEIGTFKVALSNAQQVAAIRDEEAGKVTLENEILKKQLEVEEERYAKLIHQKKSSEVRLGQIGEHVAPFLEDWPWEPKNFRFLGNPIDGIQFNEDDVVFVEIKTGKSQLSKSQRVVRDLIKLGKVKWAEFRIGKDECSVKIIERIEEDGEEGKS